VKQNQKKNKMQTATTILNQLGGNKFIVMTGSKNFINLGNGLQMKLTRNKANAQYLSIELNSMDLYDLKFYSVSGIQLKMKNEINGVYCDQLKSIFTDVTGLYVSL
jgi:hypothetical protein